MRKLNLIVLIRVALSMRLQETEKPCSVGQDLTLGARLTFLMNTFMVSVLLV
jgi:hypothetical protein